MSGHGSHTYTDEELEAPVTSAESPNGPEDFLVLATSWVYCGGCGSECSGVWAFPHKLDALHFLYSENLELAQSALSSEGFQAWEARITEQIGRIEGSRCDEGAGIDVVEFDGNRAGLRILVSGDWDSFVPDALRYFIDELSDELPDADEAEDWDDDDTEDCDDEAEDWDDDEELREELARLKALLSRDDLRSPSFVSSFIAACDAFDERHA